MSGGTLRRAVESVVDQLERRVAERWECRNRARTDRGRWQREAESDEARRWLLELRAMLYVVDKYPEPAAKLVSAEEPKP